MSSTICGYRAGAAIVKKGTASARRIVEVCIFDRVEDVTARIGLTIVR